MQDYHKIRAWQKAHALMVAVRDLVGRFPRRGYASLKSQMLKASESIPNNIAEGAGAATNLEFARFLDMAIKSTSELEHEFESARDFGLLEKTAWEVYATEVCDIRKMTWGYRKKLIASEARQHGVPSGKRDVPENG